MIRSDRPMPLSTSYSPPPHIILSHTRADTPPSGTPPLLPIPLSTSSPSLLVTSADQRGYVLLLVLSTREIRRDLERDVGYGITDTKEEMLVDIPGAPATDDTIR
ncbi:hypothetical protein Tco_0815785 [Tanacetum coccineum]